MSPGTKPNSLCPSSGAFGRAEDRPARGLARPSTLPKVLQRRLSKARRGRIVRSLDSSGRTLSFAADFVLRIRFDKSAMTKLQRCFLSIVPEKWARSMEEESRLWMIRCSCGYERSIWDAGGIRWKAAGNPRRYLRCQRCGQRSWHQIVKRDPRNA